MPVFTCLLLWQLFSANMGHEDNIFHSFELSFENRLSQLFDMSTYVTQLTQVQVKPQKKIFFGLLARKENYKGLKTKIMLSAQVVPNYHI